MLHAKKQSAPLEWLILGGGIHGVHIAARLLGTGGVAPEQLQIVDPGESLLTRWQACTAVTGMTHLRSPSVHHLDEDPWSLRRFGGLPRRRKRGAFTAPYDRPALALFNAHCDHVVQRCGLSSRHVRDRAERIEVRASTLTVRLASGTLRTRRAVLAMGAGEHCARPAWCPDEDPRCRHVFASESPLPPATSRERIAVVGGGISAAQVALRLASEGHRVHVISRHPLRKRQFDSDPGWLGPRHMDRFDRERDPVRRREMIVRARHRGSVPPDIHHALGAARQRGDLLWTEGSVQGLSRTEAHRHLQLSDGTEVVADRVLLATGFEARRPGGSLVNRLVDEAALPCAPCGYPLVNASLRWHQGLYVSGPLAELQLGPTARNIAGARNAGERLARVARRQVC